MAEKMVPGDPLPMAKLADLLWRSLQGEGGLELVGLDLRGEFRVGGDMYTGSVSGGPDNPWKLYLQDSWEYRYLTERETKTLRIKKCERIVTMFRDPESGKMIQGRVLRSGDDAEWKVCEMVPQG